MTVVCIVSACSSGQPHDATLLNAEQVMVDSPDSAFNIIYPYENEHTFNTADSALYRLLYIEAMHKKGVRIYSDSLIVASERFFKEAADQTNHRNDRRHLVKAYVQHGIVLCNMLRLKESVEKLKRAEEMAKDLDDEALNYDVYDAIGYLNKTANCRGLMLKYYQLAFCSAKKLNNTSRKAHALNQLMRNHGLAGEPDSALLYMKESIDIMPRLSAMQQAELKTSIGGIYLQMGEKGIAKQYLQEALTLFPVDYAAKLMGDIYESEGNMDKACELWFEALNTINNDIQIEAYQKLISYYLDVEQWRALDLSWLLNKLYQNIHIPYQTESIAEQQTAYDNAVAQKQLHKKLTVASVAAFLFLAAILIFFYYHKRKMHAYHQIIAHIEDLQQQVKANEKSKECDGVKEKPANATHTEIGEQTGENNPDSGKMQMIDILLNNETVFRFHQLAAKGKMGTHEDWTELYEVINREMPEFIPSIHRNGMLSDRDTNICILIKLHFIPSEIAILIGASPQIITNSRVRLLNKIFDERGGARDFDQKIRGMK